MNKHVRQMMVDLRIERRARHRDCTYRRMLLHRTYKKYAQLWRYWKLGTTKYLNGFWTCYRYYRKHDGTVSMVRCSKHGNLPYMQKRHLAWSLCNALLEDTIRCAEAHEHFSLFDPKDYVLFVPPRPGLFDLN